MILNFQSEKLQREYIELTFLANSIIDSATQIELNLVDIETGQRGYILTGEEKFLEPYNEGNNLLQNEITKFDSLATITDLIPQDSILKLKSLIEKRLDILNLAIEQFHVQGFEEAQTIIATAGGFPIMDSIRNLIDYFIRVENNILVERSIKIEQFSTFNIIITHTGILFTIIIILITGYSINKRSKHNIVLGSRISSINHELSKVIEHIQIKNQYIGMAAHDLRNPLGAIISFSELLKEKNSNFNDDQLMFLEQIEISSDHALKLVNEMLEIQTIEESKLEHHFEEFNPVKLLDHLLIGFKENLEHKNIEVNRDINLPEIVHTDKTVFIQILDNLISNAIKFSMPNTSITVRMSEIEMNLCIEIHDQGVGIAKKDMSKLFERFQKINQPTGGESSTGLGLSIVYDRIEQVGGSIICESEVNVGSKFIAQLPLKPIVENIS